MLEHEIQNKIRVHISEQKLATLFRANVGEAWTGNKITRSPNGYVLIHNPRRFTTGLPQGFPDLFGLKSIEITPEMVGKKLAAFVFVEVKQPGKHPTPIQKNVIEFLKSQGAIGGVAHAPDEAARLIRGD